jgi:redox-sensitive bicupin YhaK (pirin superfamily)
MIRPNYQEIPAEKIPTARTSDGNVDVRVIAGESLGAHAVIETRTPIFYLDFILKPGGRVVQSVAPDFNVFAYVLEGPLVFGNRDAAVERGNMVAFERGTGEVRIEAPRESRSSGRALLIGGLPLNEPIARYGPFVMNTEKEIREAFEDYQSGRMGKINF